MLHLDYPCSPMRRATVLMTALLAAGCSGGPLPPDAGPMNPVPAVYSRWWGMTESCSGTKGDLAALRWYVVPGASVTLHGERVAGYWNANDNFVVLPSDLALHGEIVRHEMLHALLRNARHPRSMFLGTCAGLVNCEGSCISDAGQWVSPGPAALSSPDSLTLIAIPQLFPPEADGQRWFELEVTAHNPSQRTLAIPTIGARTFEIDVRGPTGGYTNSLVAADSSSVVFGPLETKSWTFDLLVADSLSEWSMPPGAYIVRGGYGNRWTPSASASVSR